MWRIKYYRYANLLAIILLLVSGSSAFYAQTATSSSTPDTFSLTTQDPVASVSNIEQKSISSIWVTPKFATTTPKSSSSSQSLSIKISGRTLSIFNTNTLTASTGNRVAFYGNQFLYGHNTSAVFGSLSSADTFQIIRNGQVENYKIVKKVTYCDYSNYLVMDGKIIYNQHGSAYNCDNYSERKLPATAFGDQADYFDARDSGYDLIIMTCAGKTLPGQDATHRLLAYAVRI